MKKEQLNFKVLTPNVARAERLKEALNAAGIECDHRPQAIKAVEIKGGRFTYWSEIVNSVCPFDDCKTPEVTFAEALELLKSVEPEREFNIKPFDRILRWFARSNGPWKIGFFSHPGVVEFEGLNSTSIDRVVLFEGNEHLLGKSEMPDGWWECCEGKPVWRNK